MSLHINKWYFCVFLQSLREEKNIILVGAESDCEKLKKYVEAQGFQVNWCIYPHDIAYEEKGTFFVWIVSDQNNYSHYEEMLLELELRKSIDYGYIFGSTYVNHDQVYPVDVHLGYTSQYTGYDGIKTSMEIPGVVQFGKVKDERDLIVVTLGGSTSDSTVYKFKSWSEILYNTIRKTREENVVLYSAGVSGYVSAQEVIKFLRDLLLINPKVLISFSGVNDALYIEAGTWCTGYQKTLFEKFSKNYPVKLFTHEGEKSYCEGVKHTKSITEMWLNNMKIIHTVCEGHGIDFYCFLQPMIGEESFKIRDKKLRELLRSAELDYIRNTRDFINGVRNMHNDYEFVYDISDIFNSIEKNVYIDATHVNEEGNKIIANKILDIISFEKRLGCEKF